MHFTKVDPSEFERGFYKKTKNLEVIESFKKSGFEIARLENYNYKTAKTGANSPNQSIKKFGIVGVNAYARGNEIYLVKRDV